jgi:hypothetical protein
VNVTGLATLAVRETAIRLGALLGRDPVIVGEEADDALLSNAGEMARALGAPAVDEATLLGWVAAWVRSGGRLLDRPTHFEARDGRY